MISLSSYKNSIHKYTKVPAASAGPNFHDNIKRGKFQGIICPQTPIGSCLVYVNLSPSTGITFPWFLSVQPLRNLKKLLHL